MKSDASQTFSYDARGELIGSTQTESTTPNYGFGEVRQYDADGHLIAVSRPLSAWVQMMLF